MKKFCGSVFVLVLSAAAYACSGTSPGAANNPGAGASGGSGATGGSDGSGATGGSDATGGKGGTGGTGGSAISGTGGTGGLPHELPPPLPPGSCGLDQAAFCEEFESSHPGGRGGQIDEKKWSFARWGHETRQFFVRIPSSTEDDMLFPSSFCGQPFSGLLPPDDVQVCDGVGVDGQMSGQLNEVFDDQGDFAFNSMRVRQMFDFTDRTGTIVFDVDAKINPLNVGHGWWIELFITDDAAPMPYHEAPGVLAYPRNGLGFAMQGFSDCPQNETLWNNEVNRVFVTKDYEIIHDYPAWELQHDDYEGRCFKTADRQLNRFKFLINKNRAEIWVTDSDTPTVSRRVAQIEPLDLNFTRGYIHLQHAHYNARKDGGVTGVQTYRWDNVGFDGPTYALPRSYEVEDNNGTDIDGLGGRFYGYQLTDQEFTSVQLKGVDLSGATQATFDFTILSNTGRALEYRFNGGPTHSYMIPTYGMRDGLRGFSLPIPLEELVDGDNTLEVKMAVPQTYPFEYVANMEITVEARE